MGDTVASAHAPLAGLPAPWKRFRGEVTLDIKMPGDHVGRAALARCVLRRHARWVQHLEATDAPEAPVPAEFAAWLVAPHLPRWLELDAARGILTLERVDAGVWRVDPGAYDVLWIAANELPLRVELLPFLVARSGHPLAEFAAWALDVKGPAWITSVLKELPMGAQILDEVIPVPQTEEEQHEVHVKLFHLLAKLAPDAANELRAEGTEQSLAQQFRHRLGRSLTDAERAELTRRLATLGSERLGEVVLDLDAPKLAAWLADPDAR